MTIFVGENNSGKTYLASLLWGVLSQRRPQRPEIEALPTWPAQQAWWQEHGSDPSPELDAGDLARHLRLLNEDLASRRESLIRHLLGSDTARIDRVELIATGAPFPVVTRELPLQGARHRDGARNLWSWVNETIFTSDTIAFSLPFLPASRSGLMLAYRALTAWLYENMEGRARIHLTYPVRRWLASLADPPIDSARFTEEASFLEREVLDGIIERREGPVDDYVYRPSASPEEALPLHVTSSLVAELTPIVLTLRHALQLPWFFLEEPEAHLHPRAQRILAQVLVRLVRAGVRVVLTTHSVDFCQQINNFIRLGEHPRREELQGELGYAPQDYLRREEVAGYQFTRAHGETEVSRLEMTPEGLVMPTFNDELLRLAREVEALRIDEPAAI